MRRKKKKNKKKLCFFTELTRRARRHLRKVRFGSKCPFGLGIRIALKQAGILSVAALAQQTFSGLVSLLNFSPIFLRSFDDRFKAALQIQDFLANSYGIRLRSG